MITSFRLWLARRKMRRITADLQSRAQLIEIVADAGLFSAAAILREDMHEVRCEQARLMKHIKKLIAQRGTKS